ncbi:Acetylglutamate kinase [Gossypium arboreum]|uniref:Acetylglutamate kinase n=1 Tax=Gossypium arboreum TaxID=29729 RepID=A0A0B0P137_GOSAR|nr:Acetylglutamate kinase [Gossypium arboreum]
MFTLMEMIKKGKHLRYQLHILKREGRNPQSKLERMQDCPSKIEKLCNVANNMSQATSSLTPVMDPYGIPQAVKVFDCMSE